MSSFGVVVFVRSRSGNGRSNSGKAKNKNETVCWIRNFLSSCKLRFLNPFRTAVSFWGQLGANYLEVRVDCPQNRTGVLKGLTFTSIGVDGGR